MTDHGLFDIHCHLIPGVDDGAQDLEETRRLLRMEYEQGVRNIIATPHYRDQMFDTPIRTVRSQFALVEKCVQELFELGITVLLVPAVRFYQVLQLVIIVSWQWERW